MSNAEDILLALATAHNVVAIDSDVRATQGFEHVSSRLFFGARGGHDGDMSRAGWIWSDSNCRRQQGFAKHQHIIVSFGLDNNRVSFNFRWVGHGER